MITATHAIIFAEDPDLPRAFLRDVLELPNIDVHGGWLIFKLPPAELGIHPASMGPESDSVSSNGRHEVYLMCDDIDATVGDLTAKQVEFTGPITDQGFGRLAYFKIPGAGEIGIYQPKHQTAYDL